MNEIRKKSVYGLNSRKNQPNLSKFVFFETWCFVKNSYNVLNVTQEFIQFESKRVLGTLPTRYAISDTANKSGIYNKTYLK